MISINIAFDNRDAKLGNYFRLCKEDLTTFLENMRADGAQYDINELPSNLCNQVYLDIRIRQINTNSFLFIAYSHGNDSCLLANSDSYVDSNSNADLFINSFFYSVACSTGAALGRELVNKGSHAFIGYRDSFKLLERQLQLAIDCANVGIKMFLMGHSVKEAFERLQQYYTQKIDELVALNDIFAASFLTGNRDSLVLFGTDDLVIADFEI